MKDMGEKKGIRKRAASIVRSFAEFIKAKPFYRLREGETLSFVLEEPRFEQHPHLNSKAKDDHLIASALDLQKELGHEVKVITADVSLRLRLRLERFGISYLEPPKSHRQELSDEDDKRVRELQEENQRLSRSQPELLATFKNGEPILFVEPKPANASEFFAIAEARKAEEAARTKRPLANMRRTTPARTILDKFSWLNEAGKFNQRLDAFYKTTYEVALAHARVYYRTLPFSLAISNRGTQPANSVCARFHFPKGVAVFDYDGLTKLLPPFPSEPQREQTIFTMMREQANTRSIPAVLETKQDRSVTAVVEREKIRQNGSETLRQFFVVFETEISSFSFDYSIIADNVRQEAKGRLSVVVGKTSPAS